jgi:hypothetical protein
MTNNAIPQDQDPVGISTTLSGHGRGSSQGAAGRGPLPERARSAPPTPKAERGPGARQVPLLLEAVAVARRVQAHRLPYRWTGERLWQSALRDAVAHGRLCPCHARCAQDVGGAAEDPHLRQIASPEFHVNPPRTAVCAPKVLFPGARFYYGFVKALGTTHCVLLLRFAVPAAPVQPAARVRRASLRISASTRSRRGSAVVSTCVIAPATAGCTAVIRRCISCATAR